MSVESKARRRGLRRFDPATYKQHQAAECCIDRLKRNRAVATRYDKLAVRYQTILTDSSTHAPWQ